MNNMMQIMQMLAQVKNNPMSILGQFGIPQNIASDPKSVIQYMMNNGSITQNQYNNAMKQAQTLGIRSLV